MNKILDKQFIFIIGSPRSGTTWLMGMLRQHPDICSLKHIELTLFCRYINFLYDSWVQEEIMIEEGKWREGLPVIWTQKDFDNFIKDFIARVYNKVLVNNFKATHILDKRPEYSQYINIIYKFIPRAKFIHIIRDGRNVVVSMLSAQKIQKFGPKTVTEAVDYWQRYVLNARQAKFLSSRNYFEVRYEDLFFNTTKKLKEIFNFCELPINNSIINKIVQESNISKKVFGLNNPKISLLDRRRSLIWQKELGLFDKYIIECKAGNLLRQLRYTKDKYWLYNNYWEKYFLRYLLAARFLTAKIFNRIKKAIIVLIRGIG